MIVMMKTIMMVVVLMMLVMVRKMMIVRTKTIRMVVEPMMLVMVRKMMMVYEEGFLSLQLDGEIDAITTETDSTPPPVRQISDHRGHAPGKLMTSPPRHCRNSTVVLNLFKVPSRTVTGE